MGDSDAGKVRLPPEVEEALKETPALLGGDDFGLSQVFIARTSFYERLILLNTGTLTLLFTVVGGFANQAHISGVHARNVNQFTIGCWLLIASTVACLIHNHFKISVMTHSVIARVSSAEHLRLSRLYYVLVRHYNNSFLGPELEKLANQNTKAKKYSVPMEHFVAYVGLFDSTPNRIAFIELVRFMTTNLSVLI